MVQNKKRPPKQAPLVSLQNEQSGAVSLRAVRIAELDAEFIKQTKKLAQIVTRFKKTDSK